MTPVLEAHALEKSFGAIVAAADINIAIQDGEMVGVIGSNGAGKTTFINMVTGYLRPTHGTIRFRGRNITGRSVRWITRAGIRRSFQVAQLFPELTALDNLLIAEAMLAGRGLPWLAPLHTGPSEKRAIGAMERFGIAAYAGSVVATLPQGVRKLLDIAMATVGRPELLLLDEPTSGVAVEEKFALMDTVMAVVRASGCACLFVEHDMEIVERYAARVVAFYEGRVLADGPTTEVLRHPDVRSFVIGSELHREGPLADG